MLGKGIKASYQMCPNCFAKKSDSDVPPGHGLFRFMLLFNQLREKEIRDFITANADYSLHPTMAGSTPDILRLVVRKVPGQTTFGERLSSGNYWIFKGRRRIGVLCTRLKDDCLILEWIVITPRRGARASRQTMAFLDSLALSKNVA